MILACMPLRRFPLFRLAVLSVISTGAAARAQTPVTPPPVAPTPATSPSTPATPIPDALPDAPSTTTHQAPPAVPTGPTVLFDTSMGRLQCQLFDKESPVAVANFVGLANGTKPYLDPTTGKQVTGKHFYDGTTFHRVIPEFMIQGGDPLGTGEGGPGYQFQNENSPSLRFDVPGRLAMANAGPDTNGSQYFITEMAHPELNGGYTIFGQCDDHTVGLVASIARVERNANDKPLTDVVVKKVTVIPAGQPVPPLPAAPVPAPAAGQVVLPPRSH